MPQSPSQVYLHIVFSTKNRAPFLRDESLRAAMHEYLAGTLKNLDSPAIIIGGVEALKNYIVNQEEHHRRESFQDEFRRLCRKYGIEIDERYVWD